MNIFNLSVLLPFGMIGGLATGPPFDDARPNVLLIMTDDQGYGDLGVHGNPVIRTPNLDKFARESVKLDRFYVSPVCSPTRASLLTGRYNYRTRVVDTFLGRALMDPAEVTLAEMLGGAGYRTAIFGKWHLGDNVPMRPNDQGFHEALVLKGGGIGQPSDPPGGESYFDPILQHNGRAEKVRGYCSDVFTDAAIRYIEDPEHRPFFVYLAFNCPHTPLEVPEAAVEPYRRQDLGPERFPQAGHPLHNPAPPDVVARVYAMVSNIDENLGRLFTRLSALGLDRDTIVVFLTDNGPQQARYNSGLLDRKGNVHEGGIRVPCYIRWPGRLQAGRVVNRIAAHIDLTPTLLEACGVPRPEGVAFDGKSLMPLLRGEPVDWPDRTLYFQWHRGDVPELYHACAARSQRYKLVHAGRPEGSGSPGEQHFELFDMAGDPLEFHDIAGRHPEMVARMRAGYEAWFRDVGRTRGYDPPRIALGSDRENPSTLTRQDWRGPQTARGKDSLGYWEVNVERPGTYEITIRCEPRPGRGTAHARLRGVAVERMLEPGATACTFEPVRLTAGPGRLEAWIEAGTATAGARYVDVRRLD